MKLSPQQLSAGQVREGARASARFSVHGRVAQEIAATFSIRELTRRERRAPGAFTLIELLVVIGIIGVLSAISLPAMKGIGQANVTASANRQILDDLNLARRLAMKDRSTVYMVFAPPNVGAMLAAGGASYSDRERRMLTNLMTGVYRSYALVSTRTVGDQPGQATPRYLTAWKELPDGVFIPPRKFSQPRINNEFGLPFAYQSQIPFPQSRRDGGAALPPNLASLPYIAFNEKGQLVPDTQTGFSVDQTIPLVRGSIFHQRDAFGNIALASVPDVQTNPARLGTNDFQVIRVSWVTGKATVESTGFPANK